MASSRLCLLCFGCSVLLLLVVCEESGNSLGLGNPTDDIQEQKEMAEALHGVFEKLRNYQYLSGEKKSGWVASCDAGEPCAVRKGARFGKICNCPRGTWCNLYILKCL